MRSKQLKRLAEKYKGKYIRLYLATNNVVNGLLIDITSNHFVMLHGEYESSQLFYTKVREVSGIKQVNYFTPQTNSMVYRLFYSNKN